MGVRCNYWYYICCRIYLTKEEPIIAVGSSSFYMNTKSGTFWERGRIGFGGTVTFNGVGVGNSNTSTVYAMAVGDYGSMARAVSIGNSISTWTAIDLKEQRQIPAINQISTFDSTYEGNFQDVIWENTRNTWVAVGAAGSIFTAVGLTTAEAFSQFSGTIQQLNAVCYGQSEYIAVGNGGVIIASNDGSSWADKTSNTVFDLNDIIYDGNKFIVVGDSGTIGISTDKNFYNLGVSSCCLEHNTLQHLILLRSNTLITSTSESVQSVYYTIHLIWQTGMKD